MADDTFFTRSRFTGEARSPEDCDTGAQATDRKGRPVICKRGGIGCPVFHNDYAIDREGFCNYCRYSIPDPGHEDGCLVPRAAEALNGVG